MVNNKLILDDFNVLKATYEVKSNKKLLEKANDNINLLGYEKFVTSFNDLLNNRGIPRSENVIFGEMLLQEAIEQNDMAMAKELIENISIMGTELGQAT